LWKLHLPCRVKPIFEWAKSTGWAYLWRTDRINLFEEFIMSAYVIFIREATTDAAEMQQYARTAPAARAGHDITRLAFYGQLDTLEGPSPEGVAILRFPDMDAARAWYTSPAYQEARQHRLKGAEYRLLLVEGSDVTPA
jgi:uncharacterized protein (DUF1330 family)